MYYVIIILSLYIMIKQIRLLQSYNHHNVYMNIDRIPKNLSKRRYIITNNDNRKYSICDELDDFLLNNDFVRNKKIVSISPGGFKGVYMLGSCSYIAKNYDLSNCIFSGASAGAWNALMLCCKKDISSVKEQIVDYGLKNTKTIPDLQQLLKKQILFHYSNEDFDFRRLFIGVTMLDTYGTNSLIYCNFLTLDDAIDCCIASSHIPFVTGGITNTYKKYYNFDGGFSTCPYLDITNTVIHIRPDIWSNLNNTKKRYDDIAQYTTLFSKNKYNFDEVYKDGYEDANKNKDYLDLLFTRR